MKILFQERARRVEPLVPSSEQGVLDEIDRPGGMIPVNSSTVAILVSEIRTLRQRTEWQPIETAPKDGAFIWVSNGFSMRIAFWANGKEFEHQGSEGGGWRDFALAEHGGAADLMFAPTHWQALPKSPHRLAEQYAQPKEG